MQRRASPGAPPAPRAGKPPPAPPPGNRDGAHARAGTAFDARSLTDGQLDELTHRLIGPLTRLLRTELRLDRERIGKLRDPRH
ncbi:hypothetical protein GUY61_32300 [Streptomyces sp. GC420]|nr:hypothetical protein [Streptomyces sp. GC420]